MGYRKPLSKILNGVTRFGRLTVIGEGADYRSPAGQNVRRATFRCDCGKVAVLRISEVKQGLTVSCGCYHAEIMRPHGHASGGNGTPEYRTWTAMKYRCSNPRCKMWPDYGGRGIKVCDRWSASFEAFLADMGPRPDGHSLDRIDNDGNYEPGNCRWASKREQAANRRSTVLVDHAGQSIPLKEACRQIGIRSRYAVIHSRMKRGESFEQAISR